MNKTPEASPGLIWDTARLKKISLKEQRKLALELHQLQTKHNISPLEEVRNDIHVVKTALESLLTKKAENSVFHEAKDV